jgi:ankyrin repeat protein
MRGSQFHTAWYHASFSSSSERRIGFKSSWFGVQSVNRDTSQQSRQIQIAEFGINQKSEFQLQYSTPRMAAVAEGVRARPAFTLGDAILMLNARCSLEAFQERMLSSKFDVAQGGERLLWEAGRPGCRPIRAWLRSADFAARVGVIEWEDPLGVFLDACWEGDEEYVSRMSEEHPEWLDKGCAHCGMSVLHAVCHGGLMRFVPDLVSRFGDVDVKDRNGQTPLYHACQGGHLDVFEYLVSVRVDTEGVSEPGETILHAACEGGNLAIVRALLDMGLDVKTLDRFGMAPLGCACKGAGLDVVSLLVEHGADVNAKTTKEETPLHFASRRGDVEIVRCLHEHGAVLDVADSFSPLCEALYSGHVGVAEYLVSVGSRVESVREHWERVVSGIVIHESVPAMEWLLKWGIVSVSELLISRCIGWGHGRYTVLRFVVLREESAPLVSRVDASFVPPWFLGGYASLSKWREHELRMDLRYLMLSWRRGFVVSRLEG